MMSRLVSLASWLGQQNGDLSEGRSQVFQRRLDIKPIPSATCPRESVLPIRLRPDFSVVFEGYGGGAEHR